MTIAILFKRLLIGGAEKQALILTKLLVDQGVDVSFINWNGEEIDHRYSGFIRDNSIKFYPLQGNGLKKFGSLRQILKDNKVGILVSYLTFPNLVSGIIRRLNKNLIHVAGIRSEKLPCHKFFFEWINHNFLCDVTVFNNYSARTRFIKRGFNPDKIRVIHNALSSEPDREKKDAPDNEIRIVTVGRFVKQKDFDTSLKAFSALVRKNNRMKFEYYIAGYGPLEKRIRQLIDRLKIYDQVKIFLNPPDIYGLLSRCDIFLSTSLFEGVSNSIMEGMAAGLPIVATNVGDNGYLVKDGFNGYLVPCRDVEKTMEKLDALANSRLIRGEFGKNSIRLIKREFSNEKLLQNYMKLFSELQQNRLSSKFNQSHNKDKQVIGI